MHSVIGVLETSQSLCIRDFIVLLSVENIVDEGLYVQESNNSSSITL